MYKVSNGKESSSVHFALFRQMFTHRFFQFLGNNACIGQTKKVYRFCVGSSQCSFSPYNHILKFIYVAPCHLSVPKVLLYFPSYSIIFEI